MADARMHVVFGAGQIGPLLAAKLRDAGQRVRVVRRSPTPVPVEGIEALHGDATDPAFVAEATRGAAVVYHCINSPYFAKVWAETLPRIQANLIFGAGKAGARLVVLDNLYAYGRTHGRPMDEQTPLAPCSRKGEIRARLSEDLAAAAKRGEVRVVVGRASDFFGPGAWAGSFLGAPFWPRVLAGKSGILLFDPDVRHTYHFSRDVAAGLAALGLDAGAEGLWMLPCQTAQTTRAYRGPPSPRWAFSSRRCANCRRWPTSGRSRSSWTTPASGLDSPISRRPSTKRPRRRSITRGRWWVGRGRQFSGTLGGSRGHRAGEGFHEPVSGRPADEPDPPRFWLSNLPADTLLKELVRLARLIVARGARLSGTQGEDRARPFRRPKLARVPPPRHPMRGCPRLPRAPPSAPPGGIKQ